MSYTKCDELRLLVIDDLDNDQENFIYKYVQNNDNLYVDTDDYNKLLNVIENIPSKKSISIVSSDKLGKDIGDMLYNSVDTKIFTMEKIWIDGLKLVLKYLYEAYIDPDCTRNKPKYLVSPKDFSKFLNKYKGSKCIYIWT